MRSGRLRRRAVGHVLLDVVPVRALPVVRGRRTARQRRAPQVQLLAKAGNALGEGTALRGRALGKQAEHGVAKLRSIV